MFTTNSRLKKERHRMGSMEVHEELRSAQPKVWQFMFAFTDSMALKSAVGLRLADIMHSHGSPITLPQLASKYWLSLFCWTKSNSSIYLAS